MFKSKFKHEGQEESFQFVKITLVLKTQKNMRLFFRKIKQKNATKKARRIEAHLTY